MICRRHSRRNCPACNRRTRTDDYDDRTDNAGSIGINSEGDLAVGIGGGLTMGTDGDIGVQVAPGFSVDVTGSDDNDSGGGYDGGSDSGGWDSGGGDFGDGGGGGDF